ncbi:restriction endonuclease subunit S [Streptomyces sp. NPDC048606]|uniref:restriction endonuclease subunit S n=1 Tax=Streptomyces sp. NPDC048606 TaxID=3154726 RepID=UPI003424D383
MNNPIFDPYSLRLPDTYQLVRLGYVARLQNGLTVDAKRDITGDVVTRPYLRVANVQAGSLNLESVTEITVPRSVARRSKLRPGDVLMTEGGDLDKLGRGTVWQGELDGCLHQNHIFAIRPDPQRLNGKFLAYLTQSLYGRSYFESTGTRTTNLASTNSSKIQSFPLPLPPLEEQRRIADYLDAETAHLGKLATLQLDVRNKLDERERALRDGLIDDLAASCGELPLRRFVTKIEQGASPQCEAVPREGKDEWGVLKLSAVKQGQFDPRENKRLPNDIAPTRSYEVRQGDLLVTRANTPSLVGDVAVVTDDSQRLLLPDLIYRVGLASGVEAAFIAQVALSSRVRLLIESAARGSSQSMVKLRGEDIKEWPIPVATPAQQRALLAEVEHSVDSTNRLRRTIDRQLSLLVERRQALITAAVIGQLDVTTARQDAPA